MKTAREKVKEFMGRWSLGMDAEEQAVFAECMVILLKEQDRDTRSTCAEAIMQCREVCETPTGGSAISPDDAHMACMNARAI